MYILVQDYFPSPSILRRYKYEYEYRMAIHGGLHTLKLTNRVRQLVARELRAGVLKDDAHVLDPA